MFCLSRPFEILSRLHNVLSFWPLPKVSTMQYYVLYLWSQTTIPCHHVLGLFSFLLEYLAGFLLPFKMSSGTTHVWLCLSAPLQNRS
jgi:hypothetical protein